MATIKLTYFDFHGSRGEPARLALTIANVRFEDDRIAFNDWPRRKAETPYGSVPVLEVDGKVLAQSNAINRYVGRLTGLYPDDPWHAAICDEVMDVVEDDMGRIAATFNLPDEDKKSQRQALLASLITPHLQQLQRRLEAQGGRYFGGERVSMADLKVLVLVRHLQSGKLDHIPTDVTERTAPKLVEHCRRLLDHPDIRAYYAKHGVDGPHPKPAGS